MVNRADFQLKDSRPETGIWFEDKVSHVQRGEGKVKDVDLVILCRALNKGSVIVEKIATESDYLEFPKEYKEYQASKRIVVDMPIVIDAPEPAISLDSTE